MSSIGGYVGTFLGAWILYQWILFRQDLERLKHIPTIGSENFFGSYLSAIRYIYSSKEILEEGYRKYPNGAFKIRTLETPTQWFIVLASPEMVADIRNAGNDLLVSDEPVFDGLQMDYTFGTRLPHRAPHLLQVFRTSMTRSISSHFSDLRDEIITSVDRFIPVSSEWKSIRVRDVILPIVTRTSNRVFVGLPICRSDEYCKIMEQFAGKLVLSAFAISLTPPPLRPLVAVFTTNVKTDTSRLKELIGPAIEERLRNDDKDETDQPNDLITWLISLAPEEYRTVDDILLRLLMTNFLGIHSTSIILSDVLFHLAAYNEYHEPLRAEIEEVTATYGRSKEAMGRLHKLDSFMKEVMRLCGVSSVASVRKAKRDFVFSNGLVLLEGFIAGTTPSSQHRDPSIFENPEVFDGYRFLPSEKNGQTKQPMVSLDDRFIGFGVGRHACPGRFFAVNEIKAIVAHILSHYDLMLPNGGRTPPQGRKRTGHCAAHPA